MNNLYKYLVFLGVLFSSCGLDNKPLEAKKKYCDINKIDLMIQEILNVQEVYCDIDKGKPTYLMADKIIKRGKTFSGFDSSIIKSEYENFIEREDVNKIFFSDLTMNEDTTIIKLKVGYMANYKNPVNVNPSGRISHFPTKETEFHFLFDNVNCKWITKYVNSEFPY